MGYINDEHEFIHTKYSQSAKPAIGFKLTDDGNYDINGKILFNARTNVDANEDDSYDKIKKDYQSVPNKEYLNNHFLKRDKTGVYYDLRGLSIQNSEDFDQNSSNNKTLINKGYVDSSIHLANTMNRDHIETVKAEVDLKLANKADLQTSTEQTFNSIINVPNFDQGYSNLSNVMNKGYIDSQDLKKADKTDVLLRNGDNKMSASLDMNNQYINNLSSPSTHLQGANKAYVDLTALSVLGENKMLSNLDMNKNKIINCSDPTSENDVVTKKYMESHVSTSHIQSSNRNNVFKYIMDDPALELTEEDDIKLGNIVTYQASPHQINKNVVDMKLLLDQLGKGYYSCRVGVNLFTLANSNYTLCFELLWSGGNIDPGTVYVNGVSSIETIHNTSKKIFESQKYARLICQFDKSQNIGNNYLMIDIVMKMKYGLPYTPNLETYVVIYGVTGYQSDVQPNIYDSFMNFENDEINFEKIIDMNDNLIIGLRNADRDKGAVNLKQVTDLLNNRFFALITQINTKQNKSNYQLIFDYFFDLLDPDSFDMENSFGSNIESVGGKLMMKNTVSLSDFDVKDGFSINLSYIQLDDILDQNDDFTLFASFLHDDSLSGQDYFIGLENNIKPYVIIRNDKFMVRPMTHGSDYEKSILSAYRNKHLFLWFCKQGNNYKAIICQGSHINETIVPGSFQANRVFIHLPYKVQRIGFSKNFYNLYEKEFHKISFLEKANGTFFI